MHLDMQLLPNNPVHQDFPCGGATQSSTLQTHAAACQRHSSAHHTYSDSTPASPTHPARLRSGLDVLRPAHAALNAHSNGSVLRTHASLTHALLHFRYLTYAHSSTKHSAERPA